MTRQRAGELARVDGKLAVDHHVVDSFRILVRLNEVRTIAHVVEIKHNYICGKALAQGDTSPDSDQDFGWPIIRR